MDLLFYYIKLQVDTPLLKIKIEINRILSIQMIAEETSKPKESKEKLKKFELKTWII